MRIEDKYKEISDGINSAQLRGTDVVFFIEKMRTDLGNSEIPSDDNNRERLDSQINVTSNRLSLNNVSYTNQMLKFVKDLQQYITAKYTSVDTFLSDNSIRVKSTFADISDTVGFTILPANISDIS